MISELRSVERDAPFLSPPIIDEMLGSSAKLAVC